MNDFSCASFDRVLQRTSISTNIKVGQKDPLQLYLLINIYLEIKFNGSKSRGPMPSSRSLQEWLRAFQKKTADCASEGNRSSLRQLKVPYSPSSLFHLIRRCILCDHVSHSTSWGLSYPLAKALTIRPYIKTLFLSCYRSGLTSRAPCLVPMEAWLLMLLIFQSISVQCKKLCNIRFEQCFFFCDPELLVITRKRVYTSS